MAEEMKHKEALARYLADAHAGEGLKNFPAASALGPREVAKLAMECLPDYSPNARSYRDGMIIKDLIFTLLEEWGWTREARNG